MIATLETCPYPMYRPDLDQAGPSAAGCEALESALMARICVSRPYFALDDLRPSPQGMLATLQCEQGLGCEAGPMRAAEIGRHLAVLGACALAHANPLPERHYYLAQQAHLKRLAPPTLDRDAPFACRARITHFADRLANVRSQLATLEGEVLYTLDVRYQVLKERAFRRLFTGHARSQPASADARYYQRPTPAALHTLDKDQLAAHIGPFRAHDFPGHFDGYPSVPSSVLSGALIDCAGLLLARHAGVEKVRYSVVDLVVEATNLAPVDCRIEVAIDLLGAVDARHYRFDCRANTENGTEVGRLELELERVDA